MGSVFKCMIEKLRSERGSKWVLALLISEIRQRSEPSLLLERKGSEERKENQWQAESAMQVVE